MRRTTKGIIAVVSAVAVSVVAGGIAFAYWTNSGTGSGSAATGTNSGITVNQTSTVTGLYPGAAAQELSGTFTNPNPSPVYVGQVTVALDETALPAGCAAESYTLVQPTATNAEVVTGTTWSGGSIAMNNLSTNQDACKNATVSLVYTSN